MSSGDYLLYCHRSNSGLRNELFQVVWKHALFLISSGILLRVLRSDISDTITIHFTYLLTYLLTARLKLHKIIIVFISQWFLQTLTDFYNIWQKVYRVNLQHLIYPPHLNTAATLPWGNLIWCLHHAFASDDRATAVWNLEVYSCRLTASEEPSS